MRNLKLIGIAVAAAAVLFVATSCSYLSSSYKQESGFPTHATLSADCAAGLAQVPPLRNNACDIDQTLTALCSIQGMLPATFGIGAACTTAGFATTLQTTTPSVAKAAPDVNPKTETPAR